MFSSKQKSKSNPNTPISSSSASENTGAVSVITSGTKIEGNMKTEKDLRLEGLVVGELSISGKIVIGQSGHIEGAVYANEAVVHGTVKGNISINGLLHLASSAEIEGDISASQFSVDEGAVYIGQCNIRRAEHG